MENRLKVKGNINNRDSILFIKFDNYTNPRYYWYLNGYEYKREECQLKKLKIKYPDLYEEAFNCGATNKEICIMSKLGAQQVFRSGNTRWVFVNNN